MHLAHPGAVVTIDSHLGSGQPAQNGFYEHFNFEPSPSDPYHLRLQMKDLRRLTSQP